MHAFKGDKLSKFPIHLVGRLDLIEQLFQTSAKKCNTSNISLKSSRARIAQFSEASNGWFDQCINKTDGSEDLDRIPSLVFP